MIALFRIAKAALCVLVKVAVLALIGWTAAWSLVYCLDDEAQKVRDGQKDPRTAILPVFPKR